MKKRIFFGLLLPTILIGLSCGWDYDTMKMERLAFPNVYELIAGKYIRHSQPFYYWRVKDRERKIEIYPDSLELYDDLGVALDKIGEHERAIATMHRSDSIQPNRYETYANLGTFYIHNHQFQEGTKYIAKAIEINQDAHFGREVYQLHLVNYLIEKQGDNDRIQLPLSKVNGKDNFYDYLYQHHIQSALEEGSTKEKEIAKAIKGLAGMMHFGQYRSPILLECLGDLLLEAESYGGAGHLGARAYLKAHFESKGEASALYRIKSNLALELNRPGEMVYRSADSATIQRMLNDSRPLYSINYLEEALKYEIYHAEKWFDTVAQNEKQWIAKGINVDSAFSAKYFETDLSMRHRGERHVAKQLSISDSAWLDVQLKNNPIEGFALKQQKMDPLEKQKIDSLFRSQYPVIKKDTLESKNQPTDSEKEENSSSNLLWYFSFALIGIGIILVWRDYKKK